MALFLKDISLFKGGKPLLAPLSLTVQKSEIAAVMGPSGVGKSSLLAAIAGFLSSEFTYTGHMLINQQDLGNLPSHRRKVGLLFQDPLLFPHLSVAQNLAFGISAEKTKGEKREMIEAALEAAYLSEMAGRMPDSLSGGQKSRIALMRALLAEPDAILLDEPFSALDRALKYEMRHFVRDHLAQRNIPAILVTHDEEDTDICNQRILLQNL